MQSLQEHHKQAAVALIYRGHEPDHIRRQLQESKLTQEELDAIMKVVKEHYYANRRQRGVVLAGIGSVILVFGFLITVILHYSGGEIKLVMYGLRTVGALLLLWGMVDIMDW
jgi:hypothetical protein